MNARKIIIDCDPGIDDALALMLALSSPELEILGITTVCGNVPAPVGARNALKVLEWAGRTDIPVYIGQERPIARAYVDAMDTHGIDGLGESGYPEPVLAQARPDAVSFLIDTLSAVPDVSVIALGPLTNLAEVIRRAPQCLSNLDEFFSMGGSCKSHGNCSPVAEYNYWCDPEAAQIVYEAFDKMELLSGKKIYMTGLDVTRKIVLTPNLLEYLKRCNPQAGERVERLTRFYFDFHWKQEGVIGCVINDPLTVAYFLDRTICSGFDAYTQIETQGICFGQSVVDVMNFYRKKANSHILMQVDVYAFFALFFERIAGVPQAETRPVLEQILTAQPVFRADRRDEQK